jgi:hypothetical protein
VQRYPIAQRIHRIQEDSLNIGAVGDAIGITKAIEKAVSELLPADLRSRGTIQQDNGLRLKRNRLHCGPEAKLLKRTNRIRTELDSGPDLAYFIGTLVDFDRTASTREGDRAGIPTLAALSQAVDALDELNMRGTVQLVISGGVRSGADVAKALAEPAKDGVFSLRNT